MRCHLFAVAAVGALLIPATAFCQLYTEDFDVDPTANWTVNGGPSDEEAVFFFDYNSVGIPSAPNSIGGTTRGLKLQANETSGIFGGFSVSPTGQDFSSAGSYKLTFDWWANANGPFPGGGLGSTQLSTFGIGTAGATAQWPGGVWDSVFFAATGEGGSTNDWRAYSNGSGGAPGAIWAETSGVYAAGNTAGVTNAGSPYYGANGFGGNTAPAAQVTLFPNQTGATQAGAAGMEWHQVEIVKTSTEVKWIVSGVPIATIPLSEAVTMGGGNIFLGHSDINPGSSADPNADAMLFTLIDNVKVTAISAINADFSGTGGVDAADYAIWRKHFGVGTTQPQGDSDGDGDVDQTDYNNWRATFTGTPGSGTLVESTIPEPSTLVLMTFGLSALIARRRSR